MVEINIKIRKEVLRDGRVYVYMHCYGTDRITNKIFVKKGENEEYLRVATVDDLMRTGERYEGSDEYGQWRDDKITEYFADDDSAREFVEKTLADIQLLVQEFEKHVKSTEEGIWNVKITPDTVYSEKTG